jgi:acyl-CoA hydrolase
MRVFVPGMSGELTLLVSELADDPERARDLHFIGVHFPGIGSADYLAIHPTVRQTAYFMSPSVRQGLMQRRVELLSLDYPGIAQHLEAMPPVDVAYAQVTPPDAEGNCSLGLCSDFVPLMWLRARRRIAHINPALPRTPGSFMVSVSEIDQSLEAQAPPVAYAESAATAVENRIAKHIAELIRDGDTLQFGVGSIPAALGGALMEHRDLRIHSGMISGSTRSLWEAGVLDRDAPLTTGVALGDSELHRFVAECPRTWFTDVRRTHDVRRIASIPRFMAINSAVEVDLFGQVNSEMAGGTLQAGSGGLPTFARGALLSPGGRSLICLPSIDKRGGASRVVPALGAHGLCSLPRYLADVVVTEYGVAEIRNLPLDARAEALIAVAAPDHRNLLASAWQEIRGRI